MYSSDAKRIPAFGSSTCWPVNTSANLIYSPQGRLVSYDMEGLGPMEKLRTLLLATGTTFIVMLAYETAKEFLFQGTLTPWQSHWMTITLTTVLSGVVTLLAMNRILIHRQRALQLQLKEEKLKTLHQVMRLVQHHVNNLANNLQIVDLEIHSNGALSEDTLAALLKAVDRTSVEIQRLSDIDDPFDEQGFEITFL